MEIIEGEDLDFDRCWRGTMWCNRRRRLYLLGAGAKGKRCDWRKELAYHRW
jgi:hypothetical protein